MEKLVEPAGRELAPDAGGRLAPEELAAVLAEDAVFEAAPEAEAAVEEVPGVEDEPEDTGLVP